MIDLKISLQKDRFTEFQYVIDWYNKLFKKSYKLEVQTLSNKTIIAIEEIDSYSDIFNLGFYYGIKVQKELGKIEDFFFTSENHILTATFKIISNDDKLIVEIINNYNKNYHKKFSLKEFDYDEIILAQIDATEIFVEDIFYLGVCFGAKSQIMREKNEIDW